MASKYRLLLPICAAALMSISLPESSNGQESNKDRASSPDTQFIRLTRQGDDLQALQTAIARYTSATHPGVSVDLIGAVHIGEDSYYKTLNDLFADYDAVLYELVAAEGTRVPKGGGDRSNSNPISFMQVSAQRFLGLESQLKKVDYSPGNFVHADLSPADLQAKMKERGDSALSLALGAITEMMNDPATRQKLSSENSGLSLGDISEMMSDPLKAKRFMARQMGAMGNMEAGLGSKVTQLIVDDRNQAAMKVLDDSVKDGNKRIAIFYGAAHMPDFQERLATRGFQRKSQSWLTAWDLTQSHAKPGQTRDKTMSLLMELLKSLNN